MIAQIADSWVCWAILGLALFCYQQLWQQYLLSQDADPEQYSNEQHFCAILIGALPLLGLLGTIVGLLECFADIAIGAGSGVMLSGGELSGGIGDALLTTQLGLVCALPAWILQGVIRSRYARLQASTLVR